MAKDPTEGSWRGLQFELENNVTLNNVTIEDILYSSWIRVNHDENSDGVFTFTNSSISGSSASCGVYFYGLDDVNSSNFNLTGTTFNGCESDYCP